MCSSILITTTKSGIIITYSVIGWIIKIFLDSLINQFIYILMLMMRIQHWNSSIFVVILPCLLLWLWCTTSLQWMFNDIFHYQGTAYFKSTWIIVIITDYTSLLCDNCAMWNPIQIFIRNATFWRRRSLSSMSMLLLCFIWHFAEFESN